MQFNIEQISPKDFEGNLVFLYGTEVAERNLPLSKREIEYLKSCREKDVDALVVLDRLPYRLFIVNFDGERVAEQTQERLRRSADKVVTMLREAKQTEKKFGWIAGCYWTLVTAYWILNYIDSRKVKP